MTLAGMFLARGLCYLISIDSISITNDWYAAVSQIRIPVPAEASLSVSAAIALAVLAAAVFVAHCTPLGRAVYAIGGNEQSALLMGLPVEATTIAVYALSGFCSALGGVLMLGIIQTPISFDDRSAHGGRGSRSAHCCSCSACHSASSARVPSAQQ